MKRCLPQILLAVLVLTIVAIITVTPIGIGSPYKVMERLGLYLADGGSGFVPKILAGNLVPKFENLHEALISAMRWNGQFHLMGLGTVYGIILCVALVLISFFGSSDNYKATNWVLAGMLFFAFADLAYMEYFNSLYVIPLVMTLFLLCVGVRVSMFREATVVRVIAFAVLSALLMITGSTTGVIMGIALAVSMIDIRKKLPVILAVLLLAFGVGSLLYARETNYDVNIYNSVFQGTTKYASVTELGLSEELDALKDVFYSDEIVEEHRLGETFYSNISYWKILKFYATHPVAFFNEVGTASFNGANIRVYGASNYPWGGEARWFSLYSSIKLGLLPAGISLIVLILVFVWANIKFKRKNACFSMVVLAGLSLALLIAPVILYGRVELGSSLYGFNIATDCMIVVAVVGGIRVYADRDNELREKYGVKQ